MSHTAEELSSRIARFNGTNPENLASPWCPRLKQLFCCSKPEEEEFIVREALETKAKKEETVDECFKIPNVIVVITKPSENNIKSINIGGLDYVKFRENMFVKYNCTRSELERDPLIKNIEKSFINSLFEGNPLSSRNRESRKSTKAEKIQRLDPTIVTSTDSSFETPKFRKKITTTSGKFLTDAPPNSSKTESSRPIARELVNNIRIKTFNRERNEKNLTKEGNFFIGDFSELKIKTKKARTSDANLKNISAYETPILEITNPEKKFLKHKTL